MRLIAALLLLLVLPIFIGWTWGDSVHGEVGVSPVRPGTNSNIRAFDTATRMLDEAYVVRRQWSPTKYGDRSYYVVTATYAAAGPPTCNNAAIGTLAYFTDTCPVNDITPDHAGCVAQCTLTAATPTFAWVGVPNPPDIWLQSSNGAAAGITNGIAGDIDIHVNHPIVDLSQTGSAGCVQSQYIYGAESDWRPEGNAEDHVVFQVGLSPAVTNDVGSTWFFAGLANSDLGSTIGIDPTDVTIADGFTNDADSVAYITNAVGYSLYGASRQLYLVGIRNGAFTSTAVTGATWPTSTEWGTLRTSSYGLLQLEVQTNYASPGSTDASSKMIYWKVGYPFSLPGAAGFTVQAGPTTGTPSATTIMTPLIVVCEPAGAAGDSDFYLYNLEQVNVPIK